MWIKNVVNEAKYDKFIFVFFIEIFFVFIKNVHVMNILNNW